MNRIVAITVNRSDFGRMRPVYQRLLDLDHFDLSLVATGGHYFQHYGNSINEIVDSRIPIYAEIKIDQEWTPCFMSSIITAELENIIKKIDPHYLLLLGDRYEVLACAVAALHTRTPIVHIGGGYLTYGAIDDSVRHALTKLSHYHLVANDNCAYRVIQMGENPDNVIVVGAPDLDFIGNLKKVSRDVFMTELGMDSKRDFILVTIHPETVTDHTNASGIKNAFKVLGASEKQLLITAPAPEEGASIIFEEIKYLQKEKNDVYFIENLGENRYIHAMYEALAMFGNSSSGIIESTAKPTPSVSIGVRQEGREIAENVLRVTTMEIEEMKHALDIACSQEFKERIRDIKHPFGDGNASEKICDFLVSLGEETKFGKRFFEF